MVFTETQKNFLLLANLVIGASTTLVLNEQGECSAIIDGVEQKYNHPFMQVFAMYIGEAICLIFYVIYKSRNRQQFEEEKLKAVEEGKKPNINPFLLMIPTSMDFITSCLAFFALELMPPSLYSMTRGGNIIITALFSVVFLKAKIYRQHYLGISLVIVGLATVGLSSVLGDDDSSESSKIVWGMLLLILSFFTFSTQITLEQKYFSQYQLNPFQVVGIEGCWGLLFSAVTIAIFNFIPCPSSMDCPENPQGQGHLEDVQLYFQQVFSFKNQPDQPMLVIMIFLGIIGILFYNVCQMSVTKFVSSLARNIIGVSNPVLVWVASLAIGWETFDWIQLVGFIVMSFGTLIYNEILILPFLGFNTHLKKYIQNDNEIEVSDDLNDEDSQVQKQKNHDSTQEDLDTRQSLEDRLLENANKQQ